MSLVEVGLVDVDKVRFDDTSVDFIAALCGNKFEGRVFNILADPEAGAQLNDLRETWRLGGYTTVLTQGQFDVAHGNHESLLERSRVSAVPFHYANHEADREGISWQDLSPDKRADYILHTLSAGCIKQVVSVGSNNHVALKKDGQTGKPGARPIYDWATRARDVLSMVSVPNGSGPQFLVDAVTIHDGIHPGPEFTPHAGLMERGRSLGPDVWTVGIDSPVIVEALTNDPNGMYAHIEPVIITERGHYTDALTGEISTSAVIARALGASSVKGA